MAEWDRSQLDVLAEEKAEHMNKLKSLVEPLVREIPDFPTPGVLFRDLTRLFADPTGFRVVVDALAAGAPAVDIVAGVEARGFLLGAAVGYARGTGVIGVRKPGKLPIVADRECYTLEYGATILELADGALEPGQRVLVVDDVLATGGTLAATCALVERAGATVVGLGVVVEIAALAGRKRLADRAVQALLTV